MRIIPDMGNQSQSKVFPSTAMRCTVTPWRNMSSKQRRTAHLQEHLPYELFMMRYTYLQMSEGQPLLRWNAFFAAFGVYARNLCQFLTDRKDSNNFKASDFAATFIARDADSIHGALLRLNKQVFHPAKDRVTDPKNKVSLTDALKVLDWIEKNIALFVAALDERYRAYWNPDKADPTKYGDDGTLHRGPTGPAHPTG